MQDDDARREAEYHAHVVLGEEHGEVVLAREPGGKLHQRAALLRRHAGGRLVHQEQPRSVGERHGELDSLQVAIGELGAWTRGLLLHADALEQGVGLLDP